MNEPTWQDMVEREERKAAEHTAALRALILTDPDLREALWKRIGNRETVTIDGYRVKVRDLFADGEEKPIFMGVLTPEVVD